ncbi:hypothetical protein ACFY2W_34115 [Streptomyces sp. NPDC001262]|uniref:hypothetical protein n=1 Tax=Streptomyces sp. NPDC001262 TaxID=3364552 RepID=UPI0036B994C3
MSDSVATERIFHDQMNANSFAQQGPTARGRATRPMFRRTDRRWVREGITCINGELVKTIPASSRKSFGTQVPFRNGQREPERPPTA